MIYALVVTYNAMPWIDRCLKSLRDSTIPTIPLVVDNASTDGCVEYVRKNYPEVILFPQVKNLGFGQANNIGFRYALEHNADYVLLLNQDAALHPKALELLLQQSDGASLLSPMHLNGEGTHLDYNFKNTLLQSARKNTLVDDMILDKRILQYQVDMVCAACWLLPIVLLKEIGGFDPLFFHYGEDDNYLHRLKFHGIKRIVIPQAFMYHARERQGNMKAFRSRIILRQLLMIGTNINLRFWGRVWEFFRVVKACYFDYLPNGMYVPGNYIYSFVLYLAKLPLVVKSRQINKSNGEHWL